MKQTRNIDEAALRVKVRARIDFLKESDAAIARLAGVSRPNLSRWLSGQKSFGLESLSRVLAAVGLSLEIGETK